jgi:hypothetical protein
MDPERLQFSSVRSLYRQPTLLCWRFNAANWTSNVVHNLDSKVHIDVIASPVCAASGTRQGASNRESPSSFVGVRWPLCPIVGDMWIFANSCQFMLVPFCIFWGSVDQ